MSLKVTRFYNPGGNRIGVSTAMNPSAKAEGSSQIPVKTYDYPYFDRLGALMKPRLIRPVGHDAGRPLLIILHGLTGYKEEPHLEALAAMARSIGFATLQTDLYGHGDCGGSFYDHTLRKWIAQIRWLIDEARSQAEYSKIFLGGHSQGALCALLAAAMEEESVAGVIALAPALRIPEQARKGTLFGLHFDPQNVPPEISVWGKILSGEYIRDAQTLYAEDAASYSGPVLFVHSDTDERVPIEVSEEAAKQYKNAQLVTLHGDTHDFDRHPDALTEAVRTWLLKQK